MCDIICMGALALQASRQPSILRSRRCGDPKTHSSLHAGLRTSRKGETGVLNSVFVAAAGGGPGCDRLVRVPLPRHRRRQASEKKGGPFLYSQTVVACLLSDSRPCKGTLVQSLALSCFTCWNTICRTNEIIHLESNLYQALQEGAEARDRLLL